MMFQATRSTPDGAEAGGISGGRSFAAALTVFDSNDVRIAHVCTKNEGKWEMYTGYDRSQACTVLNSCDPLGTH
jgi:hypothetical protein